jgi:hypothetical protein
MRSWIGIRKKRAALFLPLAMALLLHTGVCQNSSERVFPQSKDSVEQVLKKLQSAMAGRLPALEGFVAAGDQPLDRYRRAYYQTTIQVSGSPSEGSIVRVTAKITAWYADPAGSHSGYRLLNSNGRLESDLLDQLSDELGSTTAATEPKPPSSAETTLKEVIQPTVSAQKPGEAESTQPAQAAPSDSHGNPFSAKLSPTLPSREEMARSTKPADANLLEQIKSLEEVLRTQAHPNNLVIVKQAGTAVVASPSITAKTLFLASAHDEFEMLDFNADWVHVRISGLSRGWIWRDGVEMPDGIPETASRPGKGPKAAAEQLFHVTREETAPFPGDWEPLKGKRVKILSIEKVSETTSDSGVIMRLEFAKAQMEKNYSELEKSDALAGIVLIFDSADGGMIAATLPAMQQWKAGRLSDSAFWHQCFFDPPEMGASGGTSGSR